MGHASTRKLDKIMPREYYGDRSVSFMSIQTGLHFVKRLRVWHSRPPPARDYIVGVKDHQPTVRQDLEDFFEDRQADRRIWQSDAQIEKGHGQ